MTDQKSSKLYLDGLVSLTEHYNAELKRWVYIFGEVHLSERGKCPPDGNIMFIDQFFNKTIVDNRDKIIDVFLEFPNTIDEAVKYIDSKEVKAREGAFYQNIQANEMLWEDDVPREGIPANKYLEDTRMLEGGPDSVFSLGGITRLRQLFQLCIPGWQLGICPYRNIRVHLIDIRQENVYDPIFLLYF